MSSLTHIVSILFFFLISVESLISKLWLHLSYTSCVVTDEMQLADELPMIYTVCIMGFAAFSYRRSVKEQVLVAACMISIAVFITVCYKPPFFQVHERQLTERPGLLSPCQEPRLPSGRLRSPDSSYDTQGLLRHGT